MSKDTNVTILDDWIGFQNLVCKGKPTITGNTISRIICSAFFSRTAIYTLVSALVKSLQALLSQRFIKQLEINLKFIEVLNTYK